MKPLIFSDLDGTFLNHNDYSYHEATEALNKISNDKIPLIFTTSKTRKEVEQLQEELDLIEPFIIENGAAILFPKNYKTLNLSSLQSFKNYFILQLGKTYEEILKFYNRYKEEYELLGFSDMSVEMIMEQTGLEKDRALLSQQRDFTEPFIIKEASKIEALKKEASKFGIKIVKGGRFYHLIGEHQDKGIAVVKTIELYKTLLNNEIFSIALGDGENDIDMLKVVNCPILIKNHLNSYIDFETKNLQKSTYPGSKGWNEMVLKNV